MPRDRPARVCKDELPHFDRCPPDTTCATGTSFDSREPPSAAFRRSAPWRIDRAFPVSQRASHRRRPRPRMTGRALPARPWPGGPERQRLPRSPSLHGPASRGAPCHRRLPDRLHYRHPEPEKNAIAGRIHARGACARSRREPVRRRSGAIAAPQGPATSIAAPSSRQSSALNGAPEPDVPPDASVAPSVAVASAVTVQ